MEQEDGGALDDVLATCEGISASLRNLLGSQAKYAGHPGLRMHWRACDGRGLSSSDSKLRAACHSPA